MNKAPVNTGKDNNNNTAVMKIAQTYKEMRYEEREEYFMLIIVQKKFKEVRNEDNPEIISPNNKKSISTGDKFISDVDKGG